MLSEKSKNIFSISLIIIFLIAVTAVAWLIFGNTEHVSIIISLALASVTAAYVILIYDQGKTSKNALLQNKKEILMSIEPCMYVELSFHENSSGFKEFEIKTSNVGNGNAFAIHVSGWFMEKIGQREIDLKKWGYLIEKYPFVKKGDSFSKSFPLMPKIEKIMSFETEVYYQNMYGQWFKSYSTYERIYEDSELTPLKFKTEEISEESVISSLQDGRSRSATWDYPDRPSA